jgi:hypothetical protein
MTQHLTPADRAYRALRDLAIFDELTGKEREAAIDEAIEQADVYLTAGRARGDQLASQLAATEDRVEELRRRLEG